MSIKFIVSISLLTITVLLIIKNDVCRPYGRIKLQKGDLSFLRWCMNLVETVCWDQCCCKLFEKVSILKLHEGCVFSSENIGLAHYVLLHYRPKKIYNTLNIFSLLLPNTILCWILLLYWIFVYVIEMTENIGLYESRYCFVLEQKQL